MVKLFVFGFSYKTYEDTLETLFRNYGTVHSVYIASDEQTGKKLNFGFIEMPHKSEAQNAVAALDGSELHKRKISVRIADKKNKSKPLKLAKQITTEITEIKQALVTPEQIVKKKRPRIIK